jgi:hypothetical protein
MHEYINQDRLYLGGSPSSVGAIPGEHDEVSTLNRSETAVLMYGLSDRFALQAALPFIRREHNHVAHEDGADVAESWSFSEFGDLSLTAHYAALRTADDFDPSLVVLGGIKLPTGRTGVVNADGEAAEVTIQPGTGSVDFLAGLRYRQAMASLPTLDGSYSALPLEVMTTLRVNGKGTDDYRFGTLLLVHLGTSYRFIGGAAVLFQVNGRFEAGADVGNTLEEASNTGGTWIFASPGLEVDLFGGLSAHGFIQLPLYRDVNGLQQVAPYNLQIGLTYSVGPPGM